MTCCELFSDPIILLGRAIFQSLSVAIRSRATFGHSRKKALISLSAVGGGSPTLDESAFAKIPWTIEPSNYFHTTKEPAGRHEVKSSTGGDFRHTGAIFCLTLPIFRLNFGRRSVTTASWSVHPSLTRAAARPPLEPTTVLPPPPPPQPTAHTGGDAAGRPRGASTPPLCRDHMLPAGGRQGQAPHPPHRHVGRQRHRPNRRPRTEPSPTVHARARRGGGCGPPLLDARSLRRRGRRVVHPTGVTAPQPAGWCPPSRPRCKGVGCIGDAAAPAATEVAATDRRQARTSNGRPRTLMRGS